jgi:hypothetical protein
MALAMGVSLELMRIVVTSIAALGKPWRPRRTGLLNQSDDERAATDTRRKSCSLKAIQFGAVRAASPDDFAIDRTRPSLKAQAPDAGSVLANIALHKTIDVLHIKMNVIIGYTHGAPDQLPPAPPAAPTRAP